ncbi:MAG: DUF1648 domain-containing protein [Desulfosporosinus sp.]|nr:DUF1648 domain-containing protein [Desulfosporosinus sp.]
MIKNSSKEKRPRLEIHRSFLENAFEIGAIIGVIASLIITIQIWPSLPSKIPAHYNIYGQIDRWGSKGGILFLLPIIILMYLFLTILNQYPQKFNYPFEITEQNAESQYHVARIMVQALKLEVTWIFVYIQWITIKGALGREIGLGITFLIISLLLVFGTIGVYMWRAFRDK